MPDTRLVDIEVVEAPAILPITRDDLKAMARISNDKESDLFLTFVKSATAQAENFLKRSLISRKLACYFDVWHEIVQIPRGPIISIDKVTRVFLNQEQVLVENNGFYVKGLKDKYLQMNSPFNVPAGHSPADTLGSDDLKVEYTAGYGTKREDIPSDIIEAIMKIASTNYANRDNFKTNAVVSRLPNHAKMMLTPYRLITFNI